MFGSMGVLVPPVLYVVYSNDPFVLPMHKDEPNIPENTSEKDEHDIRASHTTNQCNLWFYMELEVFHKAKLTAALDGGIYMGNLGLTHVSVQEVFDYLLQCYGIILIINL